MTNYLEPMAAPSKVQLFGEIALSQGLLSEEQLTRALSVQAEHKAKGIKKTLGAVLHDLGYLSLVQINAIMDEVAQERRRGSIEGYKILSKLGKGGMGSVYLAEKISLQKRVAIKVLPPRLSTNDEDLQRFKREALATAKLNHPNIVQAYDVGESNGYHYLVMEYIEGETLKDILDREGPLDEGRAIEVLEQLADALRHAWSHGIVHRDIKPANIVLAKNDGVPKLLDLGLAISKKDDFSITKTGVIMGTPYYLSPEQARSEDVDIRSDIYSLGVTLYHMIIGQPPFVGDSAAIIVSKHLTEPIPDPLEKIPTLSNGVCFIISKMTAKEREERYQTPDELVADIRELRRLSYLKGKTWKPGPGGGSRLDGQRRAALVRMAGVALAAAIPSLLLIGLTALDPHLWSRAGRRLRGLPAVSEDELHHRVSAAESEQAERALEEAERLASERPDDVDGAATRFEGIVRQHGAASVVGGKAQARLAALEARLYREAQAEFDRLFHEASGLRAEGRFAEARAVWRRFATRFARTPWWAMHEREVEALDGLERERQKAAPAPPRGP